MIVTIMAGFFGTISLISIIANIRFEKQNNKLNEEIKRLNIELEKEIEKNLMPEPSIFKSESGLGDLNELSLITL